MAATVLEIVRTAAAQQSQPDAEAEADEPTTPPPSRCSLTLNAISVLLNLLSQQEKKSALLLSRIPAWEMDGIDSKIIQAEAQVLDQLKSTKPEDLTQQSFVKLLNPLFMEIKTLAGISDPPGTTSTRDLLQSVARYLPRDVLNEIVRYSVALSLWKFLEVLIHCRVVNWNSSAGIVEKLVDAKRVDIVCLFVENMPEIRPPDLLLILNYFLNPSRDDGKMAKFRRGRKQKTLTALENAALGARKSELAFQEMARLLAATMDGFSPAEFCMHSVISTSIDENVLGFVIGQLDDTEVLRLLRYLGKWLRKYSGCHLTGPVDFPSAEGDLSYSRWVPSLASVLKWLHVILNEEYSTLVLRGEFHDTLKCLEETVRVLLAIVSEASSLASIVELLKSNPKLASNNRLKTDDEHVIEYLDWNHVPSA